MTNQIKRDIKTIIQVAIYILFTVLLLPILESNTIFGYALNLGWAIFLGWYIWRQFFRKHIKRTFWFPTVNDNYLNFTPILFAVFLLFASTIGFFVFHAPAYHCLLGVGLAVMCCVIGFGNKPQGWVTIENNTLKIVGLKKIFDVHALKEVVLKNDKITLTNLYGESSYSFQLHLNPKIAADLKKFLEEKLAISGALVVDNVKNEDYLYDV